MKTQEQEIRDGFEAQRLLENPMLKGAFEGIEKNILEGMRRSSMGDVATHHELVLMLQALTSLQKHFSSMIQTGRMAEIQKEQSMSEKIKQRLKRV